MRAVWSGSLNLGLVNIPIELCSAVEDHDPSLHQVRAADVGTIRYRRVCEICGKAVELRDITKAYGAPDGSRVVLDDEDFASLPADRSHWLEPSARAGKAHVLPRTTLERSVERRARGAGARAEKRTSRRPRTASGETRGDIKARERTGARARSRSLGVTSPDFVTSHLAPPGGIEPPTPALGERPKGSLSGIGS